MTGVQTCALPIWKLVIRDGIRDLPLLSWLRKPATAISTKRKNYRWQVRRAVNRMEARYFTQHLLVIGRKLRDTRKAETLNHHRGKDEEADAFHALDEG